MAKIYTLYAYNPHNGDGVANSELKELMLAHPDFGNHVKNVFMTGGIWHKPTSANIPIGKAIWATRWLIYNYSTGQYHNLKTGGALGERP